MTAQTVGTAVATTQQTNSPSALIKRHMADFAQVLPSHIKPETWVRLAQSALKRGKRVQQNGKETDRYELEQAALNNPGLFMATLLDAARLGLEPGTEQYYLTPRRVKGKGLEILGIPGYQGYIELMYRAGAVSSVVVEIVRQADTFRFMPGRDEIPHHEIDWDAEDRGELRLTYAFARMKDGSTSKVVVLNRNDIARIKKSATGAESDYSPWKTHEESMWLKSAVRQLQKWVPTSAEYIREQLRAVADVQAEQQQRRDYAGPSVLVPDPDFVEGEIVEQAAEEDEDAARPDGPPANEQQRKTIAALFGKVQVADDRRADDLSLILRRPITSTDDLTRDEAVTVIDLLDRCAKDKTNPVAAYDAALDALREDQEQQP
jgi:recombination protein RecT